MLAAWSLSESARLCAIRPQPAQQTCRIVDEWAVRRDPVPRFLQ